MIVYPKCPLSFYTIVLIWKRIKIIRSAHIVLLILQMSNLFTYRLCVGALLVNSLVSIATVYFIIFEQTSQIKALQDTLHSVCLRTVQVKLKTQATRVRILCMSNFQQHHFASLLKGAVTFGHFQIWLTYHITRSPHIF